MHNSAVENKEGVSPIDIEAGIYHSLSTYSNVHRGQGHFSLTTERLLQRAREEVLDYLKLKRKRYVVVFCSPLRAEHLKNRIRNNEYKELSSSDFGLPFGLRALAIPKNALPVGPPDQSGGGTVKMVGSNYTVWAAAPQRFEPGTPNIIGSIVFARTLSRSMIRQEWTSKPLLNVPQRDVLSLEDDRFSEYTGRALLEILQKNIIGRDIQIPTLNGERRFLNLDNAASKRTFTPVYDVVCQVLNQPESSASWMVEEVKTICSRFLGAPRDKYDLIFTSNTTEAINIASENFLRTKWKNSETVIVNSILEHNSNELPWRTEKYCPIKIPVNRKGALDLDYFEDLLHKYNHLHLDGKKRVRLIAVSGVSNILGIYNDIRKISSIARKYDVKTLIDGAQWVAHRRISLEETGIDCLAFSGHKIYAPFGTGVLVIKKELLSFNKKRLNQIRDSGEENIAGIAALGKAINLLQRIGMETIQSHESSLVERSIEAMSKIKAIRIYSPDDPSSPEFSSKASLISFTIMTVPHNLFTRKLAEYGGIGSRSGCLCAHLLVQHLMKLSALRLFAARLGAMIYWKKIGLLFAGLIRIGYGIENDQEDVDHFIEVLHRIIHEPIPRIQRFFASIRYGTPFLRENRIQVEMKDFAEKTVKKIFNGNEIYKSSNKAT
jgi:selenocysteine lyase/cysteine desulfurase